MTDEQEPVRDKRLDENPRHVLRELRGILTDYQLDREPPISEKEDGELEGLRIAIDEINYVIENGDVSPSTSSNEND